MPKLIGLFWFIGLPGQGIAEQYSHQSYVGIQLADLQYNENQIAEDYSLASFYGRFGALFDHTYALEWRLGTGASQADVVVGNDTLELSLDALYGGYVLVGYPIKNRFFPYLLIGYSQGEFELNSASAAGEARSETVSGVSYGMGLDLYIYNQYTLNLEYSRYFEAEGVELAGFTLGVTYSF